MIMYAYTREYIRVYTQTNRNLYYLKRFIRDSRTGRSRSGICHWPQCYISRLAFPEVEYLLYVYNHVQLLNCIMNMYAYTREYIRVYTQTHVQTEIYII